MEEGVSNMLKMIAMIIAALSVLTVSFYFWTWVLFNFQAFFSKIFGVILVDQGDEWHPFFLVLLLFFPVITTVTVLKKILRMGKIGNK